MIKNRFYYIFLDIFILYMTKWHKNYQNMTKWRILTVWLGF